MRYFIGSVKYIGAIRPKIVGYIEESAKVKWVFGAYSLYILQCL